MNTQTMTKQRDSNLELYRIILMLLIIAHHYVVNSGLIQFINHEPLTAKTAFYYIFGAWGKTGINCFVLITGYFMCKSKITLRKFLKLILEVVFYNAVIRSIFIATGYQQFSLKSLIFILPVKSVATDFIASFILFYLCIPFLNILVSNMNKRQHQLLLCLTLFIYTILGTIPHFNLRMNYVSWFCVLYFVSSYLRLYNIKTKRIQHVRWGWVMSALLCLSVLSILTIGYMNRHTSHNHPPYFFIADCNKILALLTSVAAFMYFKNLKIPYNKYINQCGASVFGVLLIHANSNAMRQWLWKDTLDNVGHYNDNLFWLHAVLSVIAIFIICTIIDQIRIQTVEKWFFQWYDRKHPEKKQITKK